VIQCPGYPRRQAAGGFTLVEVLVALLIVGLIGAVASLRAGINPVVAVEDESNRLAQTIESALDRSRLARTPIVWRAGTDQYVLTIREGGNERTIARRDLGTQVTITSVWSEGSLLNPPYELLLSGRDPRLFRIRLGSEQSALFELRSTLLGRIELVRASEFK
jgi:prepilin-type N-terminal cleavage/methylation domain-containing protein